MAEVAEEGSAGSVPMSPPGTTAGISVPRPDPPLLFDPSHAAGYTSYTTK
jgi:hypothetical protein